MRLRKEIIVRDEGHELWLYNGDNGAFVALPADSSGMAPAKREERLSVTPSLARCLAEFGFIEGQSITAPVASPDSVLTEPQAQNGFFELRSKRGPLNVLWAVTPVCNLRCVYCFPNARAQAVTQPPLSLDALIKIADRLIEARVFKVTLTGGECLLRRDCWTLIRYLRAAGITVSIISNGTPVTDSAVERLKSLGVPLNISLDGPGEVTNALTRGKGVFDRAVRGIRRAVAAKVPIAVLVTVTRHNFERLEELVAFIASLGVGIVSLQDLRPFGTTTDYDALRLTPKQEQDLSSLFARVKAQHPRMLLNPTELFLFEKNGSRGTIMDCPAGVNFAYVDFVGDMYPCTSLPSLRMGTLLGECSVSELWTESHAARKIRRTRMLPVTRIPGCRSCARNDRCEGGCRGDALFYTGKWLGRSSRCPNGAVG